MLYYKKTTLVILGIIILAGAGAGFLLKDKIFKEKFIGPHLVVSPLEYDFGKVLQSQSSVSAYFDVINNGTEEAVIVGTPTSCACTSAEIDIKNIKPGKRAKLKVSFDPNFHEEPAGKFFRTTTIKSNAPEAEIKIWLEVEYDLGKDKLKFGQDQD